MGKRKKKWPGVVERSREREKRKKWWLNLIIKSERLKTSNKYSQPH